MTATTRGVSVESAHATPVLPDVGSLIARTIADLAPQPWTVRIRLTDGPALLVDGRRRAVHDDADGGGDAGGVDCTIEISSWDLSKIASGVLNPRYAMLYAHAKVDGSVPTATRFGDWLAGQRYSLGSSPPRDALPRPTRDHSTAWRDLGEFGYAILEDALEPAMLEAVRTRVVEQAAAEAERGLASFEAPTADGGFSNQRLWGLVNKGSVFMDLLEHPLIDEFAVGSVGDNFRLGSYFCLIAQPGGREGGLHYDQMSLVPPIPDVNIGLNMVFFLDDFTEANGGTRVLPRSHLAANRIAPDNVFTQDGTVAAEGPAGSAFLFDSRLWHGTGPNRTDAERHGLFLFFIRYWMRPNENPFLSTHPSVVERMSDRVKTMYGLRHTSSLGRVGATREGDFVRYAPDELVMELHPSGRGTMSAGASATGTEPAWTS
jgi:ectoine hydroxylase-related dioxygenase (phytanoyl-CoA dioxygenase family)